MAGAVFPTGIHRRVAALKAGDDPLFIARLASGWLCLGDVQPLPGYCVLFSDPVAADFNTLSAEARAQWALDCGRAGDALISALGAVRVNYETWGNLDPALHTHITPRFSHEAEAVRTLQPRQAYRWPDAVPTDAASAAVQSLIAKIRAALSE